MNFHETGSGHRFYEQQLPELTSQLSRLNTALQALTTAMQRPNQALILPVEAPPDFLKDLYHGNYEPDMEQNPLRTEQLTAAVVKSQRLLRERVSPDVWQLIDECHRSLNERALYCAEQAFEAGFRSAMRMVAAGLSGPPSTQPPKGFCPQDSDLEVKQNEENE